MRQKADHGICIPMDQNERAALDYVARDLGYSTEAFARILFALAIANTEEIAKRIMQLREMEKRAERKVTR